jgi:hypothetical protein
MCNSSPSTFVLNDTAQYYFVVYRNFSRAATCESSRQNLPPSLSLPRVSRIVATCKHHLAVCLRLLRELFFRHFRTFEDTRIYVFMMCCLRHSSIRSNDIALFATDGKCIIRMSMYRSRSMMKIVSTRGLFIN